MPKNYWTHYKIKEKKTEWRRTAAFFSMSLINNKPMKVLLATLLFLKFSTTERCHSSLVVCLLRLLIRHISLRWIFFHVGLCEGLCVLDVLHKFAGTKATYRSSYSNHNSSDDCKYMEWNWVSLDILHFTKEFRIQVY